MHVVSQTGANNYLLRIHIKVTVNNSGTLGGTGIIHGTVGVNSSGHPAPGASPGILGTGALTLSSGTNFVVGKLAANPLLRLTIPDGTLTIAGVISGSDDLVKDGAGTLILTADNTLTGALTLQALFTLLNVPHVGQVHLYYRAEMTGPALDPGPETIEARLEPAKLRLRPGERWIDINADSGGLAARRIVAQLLEQEKIQSPQEKLSHA